MSEERKLILNLLAEGKITPEEADELIEALEQDAEAGAPEGGEPKAKKAAEKPYRAKGNIELGPDLEERLSGMAEEIEELVSDIPERVQKALDSVTISKDGKKSTLGDLLKSWGISPSGRSANPIFRIGTDGVKGRIPVSVSLVNGTARIVPNEEGTDIRVISKVVVKNVSEEEAQSVAAKHIEVLFDHERGLKVKSIDDHNASVSAVEVLLPTHLAYDITAQSVNGSVRINGLKSAKYASMKTVNGSVSTDESAFDTLIAETVNGSVRLSCDVRDASANTVNGSIRSELALLGGNVRFSSSNGTIKAEIDVSRSVPMSIKASSRHGAVRVEQMEGLETIEAPSVSSMHKSGLWRSSGYSQAKERADIEMETRNGSIIITEG